MGTGASNPSTAPETPSDGGFAAVAVRLREAVEDGDLLLVESLSGVLEQRAKRAAGRKKRHVCECGLDYEYPGELDRHRIVRGHFLADEECCGMGCSRCFKPGAAS